MMKYSLSVKVVSVWNIFNQNVDKFQYTCIDKNGQEYEFKSEQKIPYQSYLCLEFNHYAIVRGVIRPISMAYYPLDVKDGKLCLYGNLYTSKNYPKIN